MPTTLKVILATVISATISLTWTENVATAATPDVSGTAPTKTAVSAVHDAQHGEIIITGSSPMPSGASLRHPNSETAQGEYSLHTTAHGDTFSQIITIDSPNSPDTYTFDFDLPEGFTLEKAPNGGAFFRSSEDEITGRIKAPWAVDAAGNQVNTYFEIQDNQLIQKVDLSADLHYPVTADPEGVWGWTKCVAAVTAVIALPVGAVAKLARFVRSIGSVRESMQLLTGATTNAEKLEGALTAAGATAAELLGIAAVQDNC
ncbi:hypothetical protein [Corynebacterium propinquum]